MSASYPGSPKTFVSRSAGQTIDPSHVNDLQDEVAAIEAGLLQGTAPLTCSNASVVGLNVSGASTIASTLTIGSLRYIFPAAGGSTGQALAVISTSGSTMTLGFRSVASAAPRIDSTTSNGTPAPNADTTDLFDLTALAMGATFSAPSGTPANGQRLMIRIKDDGSSRSLAFSTSYVTGGVPMPTGTAAGKWMHLGFMYNQNASSRWYLIARTDEP